MLRTGSDAASLIMEVVPLVMSYIRTEMRNQRLPGLSIPQFRSLIYLYRHEDASLSQVAEHLGLQLPTTSKTIDALVTRKLVIRSEYPEDRRRISLKLSATGLEELKRSRHITEARLIEKMNILTAEQQSGIAISLATLRTLFVDLNKSKNNDKITGGSDG